MKTTLYLSVIAIASSFIGNLPLVSPAQAQNMRAIYTFGPAPDGAQPNGGLVRDSVGRLLGVTAYGGAYGYGTVYRLTRQNDNQWTEEILHSFNDADGKYPVGQMLIGSDGSLFGATVTGGLNGSGTIYRLDEANGTWALTTLHSFGTLGGNQDFIFPRSGLVFGPQGLLYGTASEAGPGGLGGIFSVSPDPNAQNSYAIVYALSGQPNGDDGDPVSPLLVTVDGHLIGLANYYAHEGPFGVLFDLFHSPEGGWKQNIAYMFSGPPKDAMIYPGNRILVKGKDSSLVGCGVGGQYNHGVVYMLTPPNTKGISWNESILYSFGSQENDPDIGSYCGVTVAADGSVLGTTGEGGTYGLGTIFHLTPPTSGSGPWEDTVLHNATKGGQDGRSPSDGLLRVGENYYRVALQSNHNGPGVVFVIRP